MLRSAHQYAKRQPPAILCPPKNNGHIAACPVLRGAMAVNATKISHVFSKDPQANTTLRVRPLVHLAMPTSCAIDVTAERLMSLDP